MLKEERRLRGRVWSLADLASDAEHSEGPVIICGGSVRLERVAPAGHKRIHNENVLLQILIGVYFYCRRADSHRGHSCGEFEDSWHPKDTSL